MSIREGFERALDHMRLESAIERCYDSANSKSVTERDESSRLTNFEDFSANLFEISFECRVAQFQKVAEFLQSPSEFDESL